MSFKKYEAYKESGVEWLGEVPKHWVIGKVKYVTENLDKSRVPLSSLERGKRPGIYPYYGASGIIDYIDDYLFDEDTILFGEDGANLLARSTPLAFLATGKYWVNNHAHVLKAKDGLNRFWVMVLENIDITPVVSGSAQPKLTSEALGNLNVVYPPSIDERQEILTFLDKETIKIDTLIDKQEQLIALLQEKRQAVISHAVTRGLDPNVRMKDSGIEWLGEVPAHWEVSLLKRWYQVTLGKMLKSKQTSPDETEDPYLRAANIHWQGVDMTDVKRMWFTPEEKKKLKLYRDDLLVSEGGDVGRSSLWNEEIEDCYIQNSINRIRAREDADTRFLFYWMYFIKHADYIDMICNKATIAHFTVEKVEATPCVYLPLEEQKQIAAFLDSETTKIDTLIEKCETAIELLKERRTALISAAVTGKIDVRDAG